MNNHYKRIHTIANKICEALNLTIPVNAPEIVEKIGGKIIYHKFKTKEACVKNKDGSSFRIFVEKAADEKMMNLIIAEKLGHIFLHMGFWLDEKKWKKCGNYIDSPVDIIPYIQFGSESAFFARCLLTPEKEFVPFVISNLKNGKIDLNKIACKFNISEKVALSRIKDFGDMLLN